jgi:hypothetical protein
MTRLEAGASHGAALTSTNPAAFAALGVWRLGWDVASVRAFSPAWPTPNARATWETP